MEQESNIRTLDSSIFLKEGAFLRWKGKWYVFQGPFKPVDEANSQVVSIACTQFFGSQPQLYSAANFALIDSAAWQELIKPESLSRSFAWKGPSREFYSKSFALIQAEFASGNWKKAVPIAFDSCLGTLQDNEKKSILSKLSQSPDTLVPYGFWKNGEGMIGLTPEILFYRDGKNLETMALAGTEKKQGACHLLEDPKNLKEHDFVVRELFEKLQRYGEVSADGPQVLELPTLYHLLTRFKVKLQNTWNDFTALQFFHPTSALGISPFTKWRELEKLPEQKGRKYFGAPFFVRLEAEKSLAVVALRQIQWNAEEIRIGAGGGVVQESQEELEWLEILAKIESVKKLMGIS